MIEGLLEKHKICYLEPNEKKTAIESYSTALEVKQNATLLYSVVLMLMFYMQFLFNNLKI